MMRRMIDTYKTDGIVFEGNLNTAIKLRNEYVKDTKYWQKTKLLRIIVLAVVLLQPAIIALTIGYDVREELSTYIIVSFLFMVFTFMFLYFLPVWYLKVQCSKDIHGDLCQHICITNNSISFLYNIVTPGDITERRHRGPDIAVDEKITFNSIEHVIYDSKHKTLEIKGNYDRIWHAENYSNPGSASRIKGKHNTRKIFLSHKGRDIIVKMLVENLGNKMTFI